MRIELKEFQEKAVQELLQNAHYACREAKDGGVGSWRNELTKEEIDIIQNGMDKQVNCR